MSRSSPATSRQRWPRHAAAAGDKNLEILGADVAAQCLQRGLVDEILVYVLPVLLGDGIRFSPRASPGSDLEPFSTRPVARLTHPPVPRAQAVRPDC